MSHHEHHHDEHEHHHEAGDSATGAATDELGLVDDETGELGGGHEPAAGHDSSTTQVFRGNQPHGADAPAEQSGDEPHRG